MLPVLFTGKELIFTGNIDPIVAPAIFSFTWKTSGECAPLKIKNKLGKVLLSVFITYKNAYFNKTPLSSFTSTTCIVAFVAIVVFRLSCRATASKSYKGLVYFDKSSITVITPDFSSTAKGTETKTQ